MTRRGGAELTFLTRHEIARTTPNWFVRKENAVRDEDYVGRHYGLLVKSIEASVEYLQATTSMSFRAPARVPFVMRSNDEEFEQDARVCYTEDGLLELVEAAERGVFARSLGYGLHHYGGLVADLAAASRIKRRAGTKSSGSYSTKGSSLRPFSVGLTACRADWSS